MDKRHLIKYCCLGISIAAFILVAVLVAEGMTFNFDVRLLLALRNHVNKEIPAGPYWLLDNARDITSLGSEVVVIIISVFTLAFLLIEKQNVIAGLYLLAVAGGGISDIILKEAFARQRPSVVPHLVYVDSLSFPSGHAVMAVVVYFTLAYIITHGIKNKSLNKYILTSAVLLIIVIGLTRVYLGVHYPSDVLAGWLLGAAWTLVFEIKFNSFIKNKNGFYFK